MASGGWLHFVAMGTETERFPTVATAERPIGTTGSSNEQDGAPTAEGQSDWSESADAGRKRFVWASAVATALSGVPLVWIFWNLPQTAQAASGPIHENNYYEMQARAIFHGHLWVANGSLGIEGFIHAGREYTYFGLFPSILRMPILLVTSSLDGKLTDPSIGISWLLTSLFASLLLWRVRILVRGSAGMGWLETVSYGVVMATIQAGTVFMLLASEPDVFQEDLAWSICLTVGSLFALLGVLERPSRRRVILAGLLMLAGNLDRVTTGWACAGAAVLIGMWFGLGRGGTERRRWAIPTVAAGLVPLAIGCAVNYAKFGVFFGVSNYDQVFTQVNAYRRKFLASNHDAEYGLHFIPSTILAYLRPDGIRFTNVFPFITLPAGPPAALGGVLFDRRYRTASVTASMPLLFLLSCWGLVTAYRPRPIGQAALARIPLLAAALAGAALFVWGYIAPRYLADFVPFLVLASAVAIADIWRRLDGRRRPLRLWTALVIGVVGVFTIAANVGMALTPNEEWDTAEARHYVAVQEAISNATGHPLNQHVERGSSLPPWGPADQLFVIGKCDALYVSNGESFVTVPEQQYDRDTWMVVERGHPFQHTYRVSIRRPAPDTTVSVQLLQAGTTTVSLILTPTADIDLFHLYVARTSPGRTVYGFAALVRPDSTHQVIVVTDPAKHLTTGAIDGQLLMSMPLSHGEPIVDSGNSNSPGPSPALSVVDETATSPQPTLCQGLGG
jgi:hypothetical protein